MHEQLNERVLPGDFRCSAKPFASRPRSVGGSLSARLSAASNLALVKLHPPPPIDKAEKSFKPFDILLRRPATPFPRVEKGVDVLRRNFGNVDDATLQREGLHHIQEDLEFLR